MSQPISFHDESAALLAWYVAMGVDEAHGEEPVNRFNLDASTAVDQKNPAIASQTQKKSTKAAPRPISPKLSNTAIYEDALSNAENIAAACKTIEQLKEALINFDGCALKNTATHTVIADGREDAPLMVISAAPGADEDRTGIAYQGMGGQLLDKMIAAIGYNRSENAYLTHIVPWRPLGNRNPDSQSLALCRPFMMRHIELAQPKAILVLGNATACTLTGKEETIARIRGKWQTLPLNGREITAMPTYHPEYLLKHPRYKRDSWQDLLALKEKLES